MTKKFTNTLYTGDNLYIMHGMNSESVDLIYLDPPFNSKRTYSAPIGSKAAGASFKDMWTWNDVDMEYLEKVYNEYPNMKYFIGVVRNIHGKAMASYLCFMLQRIIEMHRTLKPVGSFYLHCDPTASHYLKIICDRIFGKNNFKNEVVWCYKENDTATKHYPKKHDVILFYVKTKNYIFNIQRGDITEAQRKRYNHIIDGERYANMKGKMRKLGGGAKVRDWWELPIAQAKERTGYPTKKPLALLHRIIKASSNTGDIVFDPFCGCATTLVSAQQLNRSWIGIDIEEKAGELISKRLESEGKLFNKFVQTETIPKRTDVKLEKRSKEDIRKDLYKEQDGKCNGCRESLRIQDFHLDHIIPKSKGGQDTYNNYQLLCMRCNTSKGDKPMEYLPDRIRKLDEAQTVYSY